MNGIIQQLSGSGELIYTRIDRISVSYGTFTSTGIEITKVKAFAMFSASNIGQYLVIYPKADGTFHTIQQSTAFSYQVTDGILYVKSNATSYKDANIFLLS